MSRLVGLPAQFVNLVSEHRQNGDGQRFGQYVWNKYGQAGIDSNGWPDLFYGDNAKAERIVYESYYR